MKMKSNRRYFIFFVLGGISPSVSPSLTSSHLLSSLPPSSPSSSLPPLSTSFHPRHQVYEPFYADFGPLNLGKTYRFCARTAELLEVRIDLKMFAAAAVSSLRKREKTKKRRAQSSRVIKDEPAFAPHPTNARSRLPPISPDSGISVRFGPILAKSERKRMVEFPGSKRAPLSLFPLLFRPPSSFDPRDLPRAKREVSFKELTFLLLLPSLLFFFLLYSLPSLPPTTNPNSTHRRPPPPSAPSSSSRARTPTPTPTPRSSAAPSPSSF